MDFCGTRTCDLQLGYIVNCYISVLGLYNIPLLLAGVSCLVPSYFFTVLSSHTRPRAVEPSLTLFYLDITHVRGKKKNKIRFHSGARESGNKDKKVLYECIFDSTTVTCPRGANACILLSHVREGLMLAYYCHMSERD